jgi:cytochrome c oxidase accessory protein FixG
VDPKTKGLGDCVDCGICVQVCPTGIDIRNGLQYECIGCGACIDGCNQVMAKMSYPAGLIRYSTENALKRKYASREILRHMFRPRILVYGGILVAIVSAALISLHERVPVKLNVIRDRGNVGHEMAEAEIENVYRLKIMNTEERPHEFRIRVAGLKGIELESESQPIRVGPASARVVPVRVEAPKASGNIGSNRIEFTLEAVDASAKGTPIVIVEKASFVVP